MTARSLYDTIKSSLDQEPTFGDIFRTYLRNADDQSKHQSMLTEEQLAALQRVEYEIEQALTRFPKDQSVRTGLTNTLQHVQAQIKSRRPLRLYTFRGYRKVYTPEQSITAGTGQEALKLINEQVPGLRVTDLKRVR